MIPESGAWLGATGRRVRKLMKATMTIPQLEAAVIHDPLCRHYLGAASLQLPWSMDLSHLSVKFTLNEMADNSPTITFYESAPPKRPGEREPELPELFQHSTAIKEYLGQAKPLGPQQDVAYFLDRPARLIRHLTRATLLDDIRDDLALPPSPDKLEMDLAVRLDKVFLEFAYERELAGDELERLDQLAEESQLALLVWVKNFLALYTWTGRNEPPPPGSLATRFGHLSPGFLQAVPQGDFQASFAFDEDQPDLPSLDFFCFTARSRPPREAPEEAGHNRVAAGRPGRETRAVNLIGEESDPLTALYLEWTETVRQQPDNSNPIHDAALYASAPYGEAGRLSYCLGLWELMLDSVKRL